FDSGDKLIPIWTSKFYAIYYLPDGQSVPIRRQRGLDLIRAARDTDGHGTNVAGVMASGRLEENKSTQNRTYIGMAPGADYIMGNWQMNADKQFQGVDLQWFQDNAQYDGAKVMNYSWGFPLYWQFMDGSSAQEGLIDELANPQSGPGIPQVVSAGNEAALDAHFYRAATPRGQSVSATFNVPQGSGVKWVKQSVLWLSSKGSTVSIQVTRPGGLSQVIGVGSEVWQEVTLGTDRLRWRTQYSSTSDPMIRVDTWITNVNDTQPVTTGIWTIAATNWNGTDQNPVPTDIDGYTGDDQGVVQFDGNYVTSARTMTSPATATHSIAVGAHADGVNGQIASFSSRGPRINGGKTIDIAAPGVAINTPESALKTGGTYGGYNDTAGTSFAAPHVAGAIALMVQANPYLSAADIKNRLKQTVLKDGATTDNPNPDIWGAGKLNIYTALTKDSPKLDNSGVHPSDGFAVSRVNVQSIKNYYTGALVPDPAVPGGLASYEATVNFNTAGMNVLSVRAAPPFNVAPQIGSGQVTLSGSQTGSAPQPPVTFASMVTRLIGSANNSYSMTLNFQKVKGTNGDVFIQEGAYTISNLRRGDARADGQVTISDALFIAQYLAGIREPGEDIARTHLVNAASVRQDVTSGPVQNQGDKVTIQDAMYIAQLLAGLRDDYYNQTWLSPPGGGSPSSPLTENTTVETGSATLPPGGNTQIPVSVKGTSDSWGLGAYDFRATFNPQVVRVDQVLTGDFAPPTKKLDNTNGAVLFNAYQSDMPGPTGDVVVAYLKVTAVGGSGSSTPLDISITTLSNSDGGAIPAADVDGTVTIQ
ncbi:MAG: S8 family serine peptidase, partial [Chloroflexi bacterium]|nr:S8 family serine peptidase [Chloroflexota bacterium]